MNSPTLEYAKPSTAHNPRRTHGLIVGAISMALATLSALTSLNAAISIRHPMGRDCFGTNDTLFWFYAPVIGATSIIGLHRCVIVEAGVTLARIGLLTAALAWVSSYIYIRH